jgi:hypothetical protein
MPQKIQQFEGSSLNKFVEGMRKMVLFDLPKETSDDMVVKAEINHGRWIVKCPFCTGAEFASKRDQRFFCMSCFNKAVGNKWVRVEFPEKAGEIETEILKRTNTANRNWIPGETLTKLKNENKKAGVE